MRGRRAGLELGEALRGKEMWGQDEEKMDGDGEKMMDLGDDLY